MKFIRAALHPDTGELIGVVEQAVPFDTGGRMFIDALPMDMVDLGVAEVGEDHAWTDLDGKRVSPARHVHVRLERAGIKRGDAIEAQHCGVDILHRCACTHDVIARDVRAKGAAAIPEAVRAWLAVSLSHDHPLQDHLGGVTLAQRRAAEILRQRMDPQSGERMTHFNRRAQERRARQALGKASVVQPPVDDAEKEA